MKRKSYKFNSEWVIILIVGLLGISLLIRSINFFLKSDSLILISNIIGATPVVLLAVWLCVFLILLPFTKKYIIKEMKKESQEEDASK